MKKLIFLIALLVVPMRIYAISYCDSQDRAALMPYVNNVNINYMPTVNDDDTATYTIMINNLTEDMILYDETTKQIYKDFSSKNSELNIKVSTGGTYKFSILSLECKEQLATKSIVLPYYNKFYKREECTDLEKYSICKRWSTYVATEEEFLEDIKDLRDELNKKKKQNKKDNQKEFFDQIKEFLSEYWGAIIIVVMIIVGGIYIIISKKKTTKK